ncbi:hypothetical protein [Streptomyces sp. GC420]|uniref:hypothetical protein n=1 Tax=Streptomyces sp. GC420 TaxID=2697568 RepID=UPI00141510D4|nr:hypothetical protein [Streptomyces sp. GC420]NBM19699.1 hypothetical protein [Streptomyces sp. GC420]
MPRPVRPCARHRTARVDPAWARQTTAANAELGPAEVADRAARLRDALQQQLSA